MSDLRYGSTFSGTGALDMGVQSVLGGSTAWTCEFDKAPSKILAHHWPDVPNIGDITQVDWSKVEPIDVLTGGYPCQPFSHAGARLGTEDARHLWPHVADCVAVLRPALCVFENVRGHLSLGFDQVVRDLQQLNYSVYWTVLKASDVGACHNRARLFIFGEDNRNELGIRGRLDRRGGTHWDQPHNLVLPDPPYREHERQGITGASLATQDTGRAVGSGTALDPANAQTDDGMEGKRRRGRRVVDSVTPAPSGQSAARRCGPAVSRDAHSSPYAPKQGSILDGRDARARAHVDAPHPGTESHRSGSRPTDIAEGQPVGDLSLGVVVGTGGNPDGAGGVRGQIPNLWADGGRARLRVAANESLTLLPTPACNDMGAGKTVEHWDTWTDRMKAEHGNGNGHGKSLAVEALRLLPTPVSDNSRGLPSATTDYASLPNAVCALPSAEGIVSLAHDRARSMGHLDHVNPDKKRSDQVLPSVRDVATPQEVWEAAGRRVGVRPSPMLRPELRQHQSGSEEGLAPMASEEAPQERVRGMRGNREASRSSQGPRLGERPTGKPDDPVRVLSPSTSLEGGPPCPYGCRKTCSGHSSIPWGQYEDAIRRWEVCLGRPAPDPTKTGKNGSPRLDAKFTEFMMGLPLGHVTDPAIGLTDNEQSKALGNGVVPQQSAAATQWWLAQLT